MLIPHSWTSSEVIGPGCELPCSGVIWEVSCCVLTPNLLSLLLIYLSCFVETRVSVYSPDSQLSSNVSAFPVLAKALCGSDQATTDPTGDGGGGVVVYGTDEQRRPRGMIRHFRPLPVGKNMAAL